MEDDNQVELSSASTSAIPSNSLVYFPAIFESVSRQFERLCVCASAAAAAQVVNEDYSEYFGDMDTSLHTGLFSTIHQEEFYRQRMAEYPRAIEEEVRGGIEESKDQDCDDMILVSPEDESTRIRNDFYNRPQSRWFASTALMNEEDIETTSIKRKKAISAWLRPRPSEFDPHTMSPGQSAFQLYDRSQDNRLKAIAIEEESEILSVKKNKVQQPIGAYFFSNVECYTRRQESDVIPPISTADTYTTVSLCHSMDSLMDSVDPADGGSYDDEDVILVDRESVSNQTVENCFRLHSPKSPPTTGTQGETPRSPPELNNHRSLLRMTPENYIHGDNVEDDLLFSSLAFTSKFSFLESDPNNPPPMMPELH